MDKYLNVDVDSLFETYSVKEIENFSTNIQNEVDSKKLELRNMVGERYRDLIQAADTITEMKNTSKQIEDVINSRIHNVMILGHNKEERIKDKYDMFSKDTFEIAAQIKILMNLIESISTSIDENNLFEATKLFLLSRHINACLKLDSSNAEIVGKFSVARKIWDLLAPFYNTIKNHCLKSLGEPNIDLEQAIGCLGSLILLDNGTFGSAFDAFIEIRETTFLKILSESEHDLVKDTLIASVKELINTSHVIYEAFVNYKGGDGLIIQKFALLNSENVSLPPPLMRKNSFIRNIKIINRFKFRSVQRGSLDQDTVKSTVAKWMNGIDKIIQNHLKDVVKHIVSIDTIREIENKIKEIPKPASWPIICTTLFETEKLNFYEKFYQFLILERMYKIINISWDNIQIDFKNEIEKLTMLINDRVHRDMKHYVWITDDLDNPQSLKDALNSEQKSHKLLMKVKGYNRHIVEICSKLDSSLKKLFEDLKNYVQAKDKNFKKNLKMNDHHVPKEKLLIYLMDCSKENVYSLISFIKSSILINDVENCHLLARLLQAITEICPNLKDCFSTSLIQDTMYFEKDENFEKDYWKDIVELLIDESIQLWRTWLCGFKNQWTVLKVDTTMNIYSLSKDFPTWKSLTINEKGENDQNIESIIYIPLQMSTTTQCWIFNVISCMNKMIPHTLPKQIHLEIIDNFNQKLFEYYQSLCQHKELISNQKIAWQVLFDLKVLIGLFTLRGAENNPYQALVDECKLIIDPFEMEVFYPHVMNNIKDNISRLQYEMGSMIPYSNHAVLQNQPIHVHDTEPNIITMSITQSERSWIPLLPIIKTKGITGGLQTKEKVKQAPLKKPTNMQTSTSSSALSSLQEWFK